jgi:hypothetical protein
MKYKIKFSNLIITNRIKYLYWQYTAHAVMWHYTLSYWTELDIHDEAWNGRTYSASKAQPRHFCGMQWSIWTHPVFPGLHRLARLSRGTETRDKQQQQVFMLHRDHSGAVNCFQLWRNNIFLCRVMHRGNPQRCVLHWDNKTKCICYRDSLIHLLNILILI